MNAHDTSSSFLETFNTIRHNRVARGTPTDEEQDLLRAMLAFACAGLDSMTKQLIRDALPNLLNNNDGAIKMFRTFVERQMKNGDDIDHKLLADVLSDHNPRNRLIDLLVRDLTSRSLQSTEEILKAVSYFDIPSVQIVADPSHLTNIFRARNQIVHEMDVDFSQTNRNRRQRARKVMFNYTNSIFHVSRGLLDAVDIKVPT